jgi:hypothetical protein
MTKRIARTLMVGVTLAALITPGAFAATPTGTDPEPPGMVHTILVFLGLA